MRKGFILQEVITVFAVTIVSLLAFSIWVQNIQKQNTYIQKRINNLKNVFFSILQSSSSQSVFAESNNIVGVTSKNVEDIPTGQPQEIKSSFNHILCSTQKTGYEILAQKTVSRLSSFALWPPYIIAGHISIATSGIDISILKIGSDIEEMSSEDLHSYGILALQVFKGKLYALVLEEVVTLHVYGWEGEELNLLEKINMPLSTDIFSAKITISENLFVISSYHVIDQSTLLLAVQWQEGIEQWNSIYIEKEIKDVSILDNHIYLIAEESPYLRKYSINLQLLKSTTTTHITWKPRRLEIDEENIYVSFADAGFFRKSVPEIIAMNDEFDWEKVFHATGTIGDFAATRNGILSVLESGGKGIGMGNQDLKYEIEGQSFDSFECFGNMIVARKGSTLYLLKASI